MRAAPARFLVFLCGLQACAAPAQPAPERADPSRVAAQVVSRTNAFRAAQGRAPVRVDPALTGAAQRFAEFMASSELYGHEADGRQPTERARAEGYESCTVAENIAYQYSSLGFGTEELATLLLEEWEKSPAHRRNMMLPQVVDIGVGVARSSRTQRYFAVQMFGLPRSAAINFDIANRSDAVVQYELDGSTFALPPRVTRTHKGCFVGALKMLSTDGGTSPGFRPRDGTHYAVVRDQGGVLRLQTN
jgi:uncharacterized protein YkwD